MRKYVFFSQTIRDYINREVGLRIERNRKIGRKREKEGLRLRKL